ncbi:unnamed protein product [Cunninghamella echinulata]
MVKLEEVSVDQYEEKIEDVISDNESEYNIIPLKHCNNFSSGVQFLTSWGKTGATFVGKSAWVLTTSMLLLVLPLALEIEKEQALVAYEQEAMQQQQGAQQMMGSPMYPTGQLPQQPQQPQQQQKQ